jgi:hypothetical protein
MITDWFRKKSPPASVTPSIKVDEDEECQFNYEGTLRQIDLDSYLEEGQHLYAYLPAGYSGNLLYGGYGGKRYVSTKGPWAHTRSGQVFVRKLPPSRPDLDPILDLALKAVEKLG